MINGMDLISVGALGVAIGVYIGAALRDRDWRKKAASGLRMSSAGKLYRVRLEGDRP